MAEHTENFTVDEHFQDSIICPLGNHKLCVAHFICYQVLGFIISLIGIFGNVICICVWTRKKMHWNVSSTSYYLVALAISDLLYLLTINLIVLLPKWLMPYDNHYAWVFTQSKHTDVIPHIGQPMIDIFSNMSVFSVVAFTVERYIAITYPMKGLVLCTPKRARYILLTGMLTVVMLHIPGILEQVPSINTLGYLRSASFTIGYNWGVMALLFALTPLLTLCVFNTLLVRSVLLSKQNRKSMVTITRTRSLEKERRGYVILTITIIVVVIIFFLCHTPAAIILCVYSYREHMDLIKSTSEEDKWMMAFAGANLLAMLGSSLNFLVYSMLSASFRKTAKNLVPWLPCAKSRRTKTISNSANTGKLNSESSSKSSSSSKPQKGNEDLPLLPAPPEKLKGDKLQVEHMIYSKVEGSSSNLYQVHCINQYK